MTISCPNQNNSVEPVCNTVFDCATSQQSFNFNSGVLTELQCGSTVPITLEWVGCDGNRAPDATGGGVGLSVSIGSEVFASSSGTTNTYNYTLPNTTGPHNATFTWGNSNDPELCSVSVNFTCIEQDLEHENGVAVPIGFGTDSDFGDNGQVITVTNLNDGGAGSFRDAVEQSGARRIEFAVSGVIPASVPVVASNPNLTIAGSTAPGPIAVQATPLNNTFAFRTTSTDILVENLGIYQNNDATGNVSNRDALNVSTGSFRVCFSQCSIMWGADETVSVFHSANNLGDITFQYCIIAEGLTNTGHPSGEHSKGMLIGNSIPRVTIHHCWFTRNARRNPRVQGDLVQIINNVIISNCDDRFRPITFGDNNSNGDARYDIMHNKVYGNDGPEDGALVYPPQSFNAGDPIAYIEGNIGRSRTSNAQAEIDFFGNFGGAGPSNLTVVAAPHVANSPALCTHTDVTNDDLRDYLLQCVGPHSWSRNQGVDNPILNNDRRVLSIQADTVACAETAVQLY